jgi:uncharacterized protein (DUF1697 family)
LTCYVALLRAVNVSGTGKLLMADLKAMCERIGYLDVRTYINSGNAIFTCDASERDVKAAVEAELAAHAGKRIPVLVRTGEELRHVVAVNPFPDAIGSRHLVYFLDHAPPADTIETMRDRKAERIALGAREIYIDYADNIRDTRMKFGVKAEMTARNINIVTKLAQLAS